MVYRLFSKHVYDNSLTLFLFYFVSLQFEDLGIVTSIECNHKQIPTARKGMEVCIKIEPIPGETPKMFGRHFDEKDLLMSKVSWSWSKEFHNLSYLFCHTIYISNTKKKNRVRNFNFKFHLKKTSSTSTHTIQCCLKNIGYEANLSKKNKKHVW